MEFKKFKLRELATVDISSVDKKTKEGEKPVRLCNFTDVYKNWAIRSHMYDSFMKATAKQKDIDKFSIRKGLVAITKDSETRDDIGIPTYIADDFNDVVLGYHCALITPHENFSGAYLNAYLNTKMAKKYFEGYASGSGQRYTLTLDSLNDIQIWAPETREDQEKIVKILNDIDQKIILNTRMNAELETMAKQLYDYWFVQFDFPDENGKPYKSSGGKMVWNEKLKREIPDGWEVKNIFDVSDVLYGFPFATDCFVDEITDKPVVRIRDIANNTTSAYTTESVDDFYRLNEGDLIIGMDGNFHMNYWHNNICYLNQRCVRFREIIDFPLSTIQLYYNIKPILEHKQKSIKGSTVGHLLDSDIKDFWILCPSIKYRNHVKQQFDSILRIITKNKNETIHLTSLRDSLLPMLMNGQLTI
ncbi:MAG: restriction endonuclease subunit S [Bacteroidales bacterium]|nr:restriction endonuclease subunit S [Bacteroidales bacterium]